MVEKTFLLEDPILGTYKLSGKNTPLARNFSCLFSSHKLLGFLMEENYLVEMYLVVFYLG